MPSRKRHTLEDGTQAHSSPKRVKKPPDTRIVKAKLRVVQSKLDNILREPELKIKIFDLVLNMHKLAILSYQFAALYLTSLLERKLPLPNIDDTWFIEVIKSVSYAADPAKTRKPRQFRSNKKATDKQRLKKEAKDASILRSMSGIADFMAHHFVHLIPMNDPINVTNLDNQINYLATEMTTALENNIREHYDDYLQAFIHHLDPDLKKIGSHMTAIKTRQPLVLPVEHPLHQHIDNLTPPGALKDDNVGNDIYYTPCRYLPCMFYMLQVLEKPIDDRRGKMFQLFPLRTNIIPKSVRIDTRCLKVKLRIPNDGLQLGKFEDLTCKTQLWNRYFKTEAKCFGTGNVYRFDHAIITDGVSCSIQQEIRDDHPRFKAEPKKKNKHEKDDPTCPYITNVNPEDYAGMQVVGIDPGVRDLLYCSKQNQDPIGTIPPTKRSKLVDAFRYSSGQRAREMGTKKSNRKRNKAIKDEPLIQGKTVEQWQHELSFETKKTASYETLLKYIKKKIQVNRALLDFWSREQFRLLKWRAKINKRRSEDEMVKRFKEKFGPPEETLIAMGDWSRGRGLKFGGPTKGKTFRILFGRFRYKMAMVHEYCTSKMCYNCHSKTKNGQKRPEEIKEKPTPQPQTCPFTDKCSGCTMRDEEWAKKQAEKTSRREKIQRSIHGLLVCKTCNTFWNRDLNGSLNIGLVAREYLAGRERPEYLNKQQQGVAESRNSELDTR